MTEILLLIFAFLAGLIDSVVGGGGLIQAPALLVLLPGVEVASIFGTNKMSSIGGTTFAALQYKKHVHIDWHWVFPTALAAFVFSFLGARAVTLLDTNFLRPVVLVLLIAVAIYTFIRKDFGALHLPKLSAQKQRWFGVGIGAAIGFYDGFFGPGTGSFLIFVFIGVYGFDFLSASAASKVVNIATNLSALLYFGWTQHILYELALPMMACNILGALVGTRLAVLKGSAFIRVLFLFVVTAMIMRYAYDLLAVAH